MATPAIQPIKASQGETAMSASSRSTMTATEASADAGREKRAGRAQQFRGVDGAVRLVERQLRRVDAEIEADHAEQHHQHQKALRGQRGDRGPDIGADEQPARGAGHRKANPLQHMGSLPDTKSHGGPL